ncbi:MAG: Protein-disulfide isomerase [Parcubacteria group bacterium GW2011_GWC1_38_6]|nr:MAG: Protein-disulfide isomerase [Parcubacteria group bacterium GW2011_GWC1_38_6]
MENQAQEQQLTKKERKELKRQQKFLNIEQNKKRKKMQRVIFWIIIIVVVITAIFVLIKLNKNPQTNNNIQFDPSQDWVKGNKEARVKLIEYSDLQCPACRAYQPILKQAYDEFGDQTSFVFRHFPLKSIHKNAALAAQAAEAAGVQGKFWEMHDILYEKQIEWSDEKNPTDKFVEYAQSLGLSVEQFKSDINSGTIKEKVEFHYQASIALGLDGTPTFFLNDKKIQPPSSYEELKSLIELEMNKFVSEEINKFVSEEIEKQKNSQ